MQDVLGELRSLTKPKLQSLLGINDNLGKLNYQRYKDWDDLPPKQAMWMYSGPAFKALGPEKFTADNVDYAQSHVRILSGLYGLLKPCDLIKPYRIDMGKKLQVNGCKDLYAHWRPHIRGFLRKELQRVQDDDGLPRGTIVSCASNEYFKAVDTKELGKDFDIVKCAFQESSGRTISVYGKRARGMMVRFAVETGAQTVDDLKKFKGYPDMESYAYDPKRSSTDEMVFVRVVGNSATTSTKKGSTTASSTTTNKKKTKKKQEPKKRKKETPAPAAQKKTRFSSRIAAARNAK
eukprot:jgi/Bigna1/90988/estExt_fgenesh1_pg.C_850032